jgi:hypothetical protein
MNTYIKYCPNVFIAKCAAPHEKGEIIEMATRYGDSHEVEVHNFIGYSRGDNLPCYSVTRTDGFNAQERARRRAERISSWADSAARRGTEWQEKANEGADFLRLGEPIKVGHHSEKRHRALIDRNWNRMGNAVKEYKKAEAYEDRISFWENKAAEVNLSMPESLEFFDLQLAEAIEYQQGLKSGNIERSHSYSLTYATKRVKELKKKLELAKKLWA